MEKGKHGKVMPMSGSSVPHRFPGIVHQATNPFFIQIYLTCNEIDSRELGLALKT